MSEDARSTRWIEVTGNSMYPYLRSGDWLLVRKLTQKPEVGSLVVGSLNHPQNLVVHRLIQNSILKGDAAKISDDDAFNSVTHQEVVIGRRISNQKNAFDVFSYSWRRIARAQAWLSSRSQYKLGKTHWLAGFCLKIFNYWIRFLEDKWFLSRARR